MKPFYVTTPIYYVNDLPHIGHIYSTVVTDTVARYHRLMGEPTRFLTGTDEHGQNIEKAATAQGIAPIELADRVVLRYHDLYKTFEISHDDFIRTTEPRHLRRGRGADRTDREGRRPLRRPARRLVLLELRDLLHRERARLREAMSCPRNTHVLGVGGERLLSPVKVRGSSSRALCAAPRVRPARNAPGGGRLLRQGRVERPVGLALEGQVGHPVSRAPRPCRLRLVRRPLQLHHGARLRLERSAPVSGVLGEPAGPARPHHRQGHPPVPRRLLAGVPALGRPAAADDRVGARLVAARRQEDVEVGRQRRAARRSRRALRARRAAVLPAAGDGVRAGRAVFGRGVPRPLQRGPRQRPGQHGLPRRGALPPDIRRNAERCIRRQRHPAGLGPGARRMAGRPGRVRASRGPSKLSGGFLPRSTATSSRRSPGRSARRKASRPRASTGFSGRRRKGCVFRRWRFRRSCRPLRGRFSRPLECRPETPRASTSTGESCPCRLRCRMPRRSSRVSTRARI